MKRKLHTAALYMQQQASCMPTLQHAPFKPHAAAIHHAAATPPVLVSLFTTPACPPSTHSVGVLTEYTVTVLTEYTSLPSTTLLPHQPPQLPPSTHCAHCVLCCCRQAELGIGDCGGLRLIPGMTKSGKQRTPQWLQDLLGVQLTPEQQNPDEITIEKLLGPGAAQ